MKNSRSMIVAVALAGMVAVPALVLAAGGHRGARQDGPGMDGFGARPGMLLRLADRLDLSTEQRARIESIIEQERPAVQQLRTQLMEARRAFRDTMTPGSFDEAAVRAHAEAQSKLMTEMMVANARMKAHVLAVLTPEQLSQLEEIRDLFHDFAGPHRGGFRR